MPGPVTIISMQAHSPQSDRRSILLGMTLNELAFLLFFLLVLISTHLLEARNRQIAAKAAQLTQLQQRLLQQQAALDETFKKLGILQTTFDRLQELQPRILPGELDEHFERLVEAESKARADNQYLRNRLNELSELLKANDLLRDSGGIESPVEAVRQLLARQKEITTQIKTLHSRYSGSGVDHLPCWTDPESGEIEYLYRITILENRLKIDPAWPARRSDAIKKLNFLHPPADHTVSQQEFSRLARPILAWSQQHHPECRHFVRVHDLESTSKTAFKKQLRLIETFFYKYLEPDKS